MKKHIMLSILFISSMGLGQTLTLGAFSEGAGLSDSRLMDAVTGFTSKVRNKMVLASNIKGLSILEEQFQGRLDYFGRDVKGDAFSLQCL